MCHDLDEVTKFKGYYTRAQWKDIVVTMREYGASLADGEVDLLSDYLAETLGKKEEAKASGLRPEATNTPRLQVRAPEEPDQA